MKKTTMCIRCGAVALLAALDGTAGAPESEQQGTPIRLGQGAYTAASNERYTLEVDTSTCRVWVTDKQTGHVWSTNPTEEQMDAVRETDAVRSQIHLTYADTSDKQYTIYSYPEAVSKSQVALYQTEEGLRAVYDMGQADAFMAVPEAIREQDMETLLGNMSGEDKSYVLEYYRLWEAAELTGSVRDDMLKKYPVLKEENVYELRDVGSRVRQQLNSLFRTAGLSSDALQSMYDAVGYTAQDEVYPYFQVTVDYTLTSDGLSWQVDPSLLQYDAENYRLLSLSVAPFFGALVGGEGYLLVPDGSGALIDAQSGEAGMFAKQLYGRDASYAEPEFTRYEEAATLPVFGIKSGEHALLGVIESGAALATVNAASCNGPYLAAFVSPAFEMTPREEYVYRSTSKSSSATKYAKTLPQSPLKVRYVFLDGEQADYSGMASWYRSYLFSDREKAAASDMPFYLQSVGALPKKERVLGVPMDTTKVLTSFEQAEEILARLQEAGVRNIHYRFSGWMNGGYQATAPTRLKVLGKLGGQKGLETLLEHADEYDARIYPDVDFLYVKQDNWFDGFSSIRDTARSLDGRVVSKLQFEYQ